MTFKQFENWCNERSCDGCWGAIEAMVCIGMIREIRKLPFWKREKEWRNKYEKKILDEIVNPLKKKMDEFKMQI